MASDEMTTSALLRSLKIGGLVGRVGTSMVGSRLMEIGRADEAKRKQRADNLVKNAQRVVESLGQLKGAAMKVGQMLSLQEGLLPPEVARVLRTLQKEAPRVPPEVMRFEAEGALGNFYEVFEWMEDDAFAAASIGQVHRARLVDGRDVAVKIQYPLIDQIVRADLKNLRVLVSALFGLFSDVDFEPFWLEIRDRLLEELDYGIEAESIRRMTDLHVSIPEIIIPGVVAHASRSTILTMEYVEGIPASELCSEAYPQELRDRCGAVLLEFLFRGLFEHRVLHADPNLANFAFRKDGRVVVYDFGCVKRVPREIAAGYADLILAVIEDRNQEIPEILRRMGIYKGAGEAMQVEITDAYATVLGRIVREDPPYTFGADDLYDELMQIGLSYWSESTDLQFPSDLVFVNRTFAGHVANLGRLRAVGKWREMIRHYAEIGRAGRGE